MAYSNEMGIFRIKGDEPLNESISKFITSPILRAASDVAIYTCVQKETELFK